MKVLDQLKCSFEDFAWVVINPTYGHLGHPFWIYNPQNIPGPNFNRQFPDLPHLLGQDVDLDLESLGSDGMLADRIFGTVGRMF